LTWSETMSPAPRPAEGADQPPPSAQSIELREERARVRIRRVEAGRVHLGKRVRTESQSVEVPVMIDAAVVVERRPVERRPGRPVGEGEFVVPLFAETASASVRARIYERVHATVEKETVRESVETTVRRETLDEERESLGGGDAGRRW
jgi:uncharacterized protein (TIGR02271 family)